MSDHNERIVSEFSRKAELYAQAEELNDIDALNLLSEQARIVPEDVVLDVACGPGIVSCHLARTARSVIGVDLTEAMLDQARINQSQQGLENISWTRADVTRLPFPDRRFSLVVSRYAFHHLLDPRRVLDEMLRVCSPTGRIAVADIALPDDSGISRNFNAAERLRDPSHVKALSVVEHRDMLADAGLTIRACEGYRIQFELENLLRYSSASESDKQRIPELLADSSDLLFQTHNHQSFVYYPISVFVASK